MRYLTDSELVHLNTKVSQKYSKGESVGLQSYSGLKKVLSSLETYSNVHSKAAALFLKLAVNKYFCSSNKRTAYSAMVVFLGYNGYRLGLNKEQVRNLITGTVQRKYAERDIERLLKTKTVKVG